MESILSVLLLVLVLLFYFSNKNNTANKWCAAAGLICWLGFAKEALLYNIIPFLETVIDCSVPERYYMGAYSVMTWALYSLAMPTAVIFSLYFCNMNITRPKIMSKIRILIYVPAIILSFFFTPLTFRTYQLGSLGFWIVYAVYDLNLGVAFTYFLFKGVRNEKPGKAKKQKKLVRLIVLPPILFWLVTLFFTHPFQLNKMFKLWQGNIIILSICIILYIIMAFKEGVMGLRLTSESYQWNSDLYMINKGAEYTSHMVKNQTAKMEWCIENLKTQFSGNEAPEELAILSRSISSLKSYMEKMKKHSETICLLEESCNLKTLLEGTLPSSNSVPIHISVQDDIYVLCDRTHMSEVFGNILSNAMEASNNSGTIDITGDFDKGGQGYLLSFTDHGIGINKEDLKSMFTPYFTTKNTERNFGLGLAYCKNVVIKHGGDIHAQSEWGKGAIVTIEFPAKRIVVGNAGRKEGNKNA